MEALDGVAFVTGTGRLYDHFGFGGNGVIARRVGREFDQFDRVSLGLFALFQVVEFPEQPGNDVVVEQLVELVD